MKRYLDDFFCKKMNEDSVIFLHGSDDGDEYTVNPGEIIVKLSKKEFINVDGMPRKVHVVKKEDFNKTFKH